MSEDICNNDPMFVRHWEQVVDKALHDVMKEKEEKIKAIKDYTLDELKEEIERRKAEDKESYDNEVKYLREWIVGTLCPAMQKAGVTDLGVYVKSDGSLELSSVSTEEDN